MILAHISFPTTYQVLLNNHIWQEALDWISSHADTSPNGIYELRGQDMYVNVHGYETLPENHCRFESHRRYIDLQYCIAGGEQIDWLATPQLQNDGDYDPKKDFQYYKSVSHGSHLFFTKGVFGIFFPEDGHRPKMIDGIHTSVRKLVVKINIDLLGGTKNKFSKE